MPRIPLLRQPGPIADAPRAVLDTQRRPTVNRSGEMNALGRFADATKMPDVDANAMVAPYKALGAVGEAVQRSGSILGALAQKKAEAETQIQVAEADQAMEDGYNEHLNFRAANPDPNTWEGNMTETLAKTRKRIESNPHLSQVAKEQIKIRGDRFVGHSIASVREQSAKQTFKKAASVMDAGIMRAETAGDFEGSVRLTKEKVAAGYGYEHEVAAQEGRVKKLQEQKEKDDHAQEVNTVYALALADPYKTEEDFDKLTEGMDPQEKDSLKTQIYQEKRARSSAESDALSDRMASGEFVSLASLQAAFPEKMTPTVRKQFEGAFLRSQIPGMKAKLEADAPQNFARFSDVVEKYDAKEDPEGIRYAQIVMSVKQAMPEELRGEILGPLYRKRPGADGAIEAPEPLRASVRDIVNTMFDAEALGKYKTEVPGNTIYDAPKVIEDPKAKATAYAKKGDVMIYMGKWMTENPTATPDQAYSVVRDLLANKVPTAIRSTVRPVSAADITPRPVTKRTRAEPVLNWDDDLPNEETEPGESLLLPFLDYKEN